MLFGALPLLESTSDAGAQDERQPVFVRPGTLTDGEVELAIATLKEALVGLQSPQGTWERQYPQGALAHLNMHGGGQTALATLAMLSAGESYQSEHLKPALDFMASSKTDYTYVRSLRAHIWAQLPQRVMTALDADRKWLLNAYGYNVGSWGYTSVADGTTYDNSLTQYGILGLWEAAKRGLEVPTKLWKRAEDHFVRTQLVDGGWNYRPQWGKARGSMTAAGLTCLFVTQDFLHASDYVRISRKERPEEAAIRKGLQWLDQQFTADLHPGGPGNAQEFYFYYYLYGIERVGLASGYRRFANKDWFRAGAAAIIERMCDPVWDRDGKVVGYTIKPAFAGTGDTEVRVVQLSFALMFLAHGRLPIVVSKLQDEDLVWNNRPRDAANWARWIGSEVEERRNWQILEIQRPMAEWFDGPLVYLASHATIPYLKEHELALRHREQETQDALYLGRTKLERLRRYLSLGGMLVTNADGSRGGVMESVRDAGLLMFPGSEWRKLPEDHWAYTLSAPVLKRPILWGLTNGVRELIIHFENTDVGSVLQLNQKGQDEDVWATLANIYYYASERGLTRARLERKLPVGITSRMWSGPTRLGDANLPRRATIWRGVYGAGDDDEDGGKGHWNPEPAADEILQIQMARERGIALDFVDVPLTQLHREMDADGGGGFLYLRGTAAVEFSEAELAGVKRFAEAGGVVLVENVGGVGDFAKRAEEAIRGMLEADGEGGGAGKRFRRVATRHPIVSGLGLAEGEDCGRVIYRLYSLERFGTREYKPRIRALDPKFEGGGVLQIFVSRDDLSYALLDQPCWGVSGYSALDAGQLLGNILEFSMLDPAGE